MIIFGGPSSKLETEIIHVIGFVRWILFICSALSGVPCCQRTLQKNKEVSHCLIKTHLAIVYRFILFSSLKDSIPRSLRLDSILKVTEIPILKLLRKWIKVENDCQDDLPKGIERNSYVSRRVNNNDKVCIIECANIVFIHENSFLNNDGPKMRIRVVEFKSIEGDWCVSISAK